MQTSTLKPTGPDSEGTIYTSPCITRRVFTLRPSPNPFVHRDPHQATSQPTPPLRCRAASDVPNRRRQPTRAPKAHIVGDSAVAPQEGQAASRAAISPAAAAYVVTRCAEMPGPAGRSELWRASGVEASAAARAAAPRSSVRDRRRGSKELGGEEAWLSEGQGGGMEAVENKPIPLEGETAFIS